MIPTNPIPEVPNYGSSAQYKDLPSPEQIRAGVIPLDSLPAAWWNALWACTNTAVNDARSAVGTLINEVCNAITGAGICINESCIDQLYQAIDTIRQRIGNAVTAGAVKSSSCGGQVTIENDGTMTMNGVGNAALLNTSSKVVVGAINELKSTYDCCITDLNGCINSVDNSKAPTSHVSSATTYGVGNADCYGHLKISDTYTSCVGAAADGVAASQKALYCVYCAISAAASLGNSAGCPLGTAAAGTATTAARSDHVHPLQNYIPYTGTGCCSVTAYQASTAYCGSPASEWASYLIFNHGDGSSYYNQMIRMPFGGVPQYQRKSNGTNSGWKTFITSENIGSQSVCCATCATSATCVCMDCFTGSADRPVMISTVSNTITGWTNAILGPSTACKLTFNPATGLLKIPGGGIADVTNTTCKVTFNFGAEGLQNPTWVAAWNGYELRATSRSALCVSRANEAYNHINNYIYSGCCSTQCGSTCIREYNSGYHCLCAINNHASLPVIVSWWHCVGTGNTHGGAFLAPGQSVDLGGFWNCCADTATYKKILIWTFKEV